MFTTSYSDIPFCSSAQNWSEVKLSSKVSSQRFNHDTSFRCYLRIYSLKLLIIVRRSDIRQRCQGCDSFIDFSSLRQISATTHIFFFLLKYEHTPKCLIKSFAPIQDKRIFLKRRKNQKWHEFVCWFYNVRSFTWIYSKHDRINMIFLIFNISYSCSTSPCSMPGTLSV